MRAVLPFLLLTLPACFFIDEPEWTCGDDDLGAECDSPCGPPCGPNDCESPNPGSCESIDDCVTTPGEPGYGECVGEIYECRAGEWRAVAVCEPAYHSVVGPVSLDQTVLEFPESCPELPARASFTLTATAEGTLTAEAPMQVITSRLDVYQLDATATATMIGTDVWGDTAVSLDYRFDFNQYGNVQGIGTVAAGECAYSVYLTGSYQPQWGL